jgi:cell division septation protein DedD
LALDLDRSERAPKTILTRAPLVPRGLLAAVGVGVAFGLGMVIGGVGEARGASPGGLTDRGGALSSAAARTKGLEEKRAAIKLTYASELLKPDPPPPARRLDKVSAPVELTPPPAAEGIAAALIDAPPPPLPDPPAPPPTPTPPAPLAAGPGEGTPERTASADEEPEAHEAGAPAAERADPARLQAALARVLGSAPALADPPVASRTFALQVASAPTRSGAEELAHKLEGQGHRARVVEGEVGGKAVFRVRVGGFADRAQADAYKAKLQTPAFVVAE